MTKTYLPRKLHLGLETLVNKIDLVLQDIGYLLVGNRPPCMPSFLLSRWTIINLPASYDLCMYTLDI